MAGGHRLPPFYPVLQRGNPLARRLLHAALGVQRGFRFDPAADDFIARDVRTNRIGRVANGAALNYGRTSFGRSIENPVAGTEVMYWNDVNNEFDSGRGITAFFVAKPLSVDQPNVAVMYSKRDSSSALAAGWEMQTTSAPSPDTWIATVSTGAVATSVSSVSGLSLTRTDVVCFRADPERSALSIWVNGKKEATTALVTVPGNNAIALRTFNTFEGNVNCWGYWNRPLSDAEIRLLALDPYRLWRPQSFYRMTEGLSLGGFVPDFFLTF